MSRKSCQTGLLFDNLEDTGGVIQPYGSAYARAGALVVYRARSSAPGLLGTLRLADASIYDKYHRVAFHSLPGLILAVFLAATIARKWPERWLLPTFRPKNEGLPRIDPSRWRLMAFSGVAVLFHFLGDWRLGRSELLPESRSPKGWLGGCRMLALFLRCLRLDQALLRSARFCVRICGATEGGSGQVPFLCLNRRSEFAILSRSMEFT